MIDLKKKVASHKILQFLQNNKVIFFFQKKSVQSDHWGLLKKKIAKIDGVASLNLKNKSDKREMRSLILSQFPFTPQPNIVCAKHRDSPIETLHSACNNVFGLSTEKEQRCECSASRDTVCSEKNKRPSTKLRDSLPSPLSLHRDAPLSKDRDLPSDPFQKKEILKKDLIKIDSKKKNLLSKEDRDRPLSKSLDTDLQSKSPDTDLQSKSPDTDLQFETVERLCGLLYGPNFILKGDSLKKVVSLSHQLEKDSNLVFIGGWDGNCLINHLDSLKLGSTPQEIWKEGLSGVSSGRSTPSLFSCVKKRKKSFLYSLKEKLYALLLLRSLEGIKGQEKNNKKDLSS